MLANELRGRNIPVNAVAPGPVTMEMFLAGKTETQIEQLSSALGFHPIAAASLRSVTRLGMRKSCSSSLMWLFLEKERLTALLPYGGEVYFWPLEVPKDLS